MVCLSAVWLQTVIVIEFDTANMKRIIVRSEAWAMSDMVFPGGVQDFGAVAEVFTGACS